MSYRERQDAQKRLESAYNQKRFLKARIVDALARRMNNEIVESYVLNVEHGILNESDEGCSVSDTLLKFELWADEALECNESAFKTLWLEGETEFNCFISTFELHDPSIFYDVYVYEETQDVLESWFEMHEVPEHVRWYIDSDKVLRDLAIGGLQTFGTVYVECP